MNRRQFITTIVAGFLTFFATGCEKKNWYNIGLEDMLIPTTHRNPENLQKLFSPEIKIPNEYEGSKFKEEETQKYGIFRVQTEQGTKIFYVNVKRENNDFDSNVMIFENVGNDDSIDNFLSAYSSAKDRKISEQTPNKLYKKLNEDLDKAAKGEIPEGMKYIKN